MEPKQHKSSPIHLPVTSYAEQRRRERFSATREPTGFDRYQYQQALLRNMSVLGGPNDPGGTNPARYIPGGDSEPLS